MPKRGGFGARGSATAGDGPRDPADADACREAALTLLDAAARPRKALAQRLAGKGYDELVIETTVSRLEELGLVDDEAYAEGFLRYCLKRNLGERGAVREMVRKGLERPLAEQVVAKAVRQGLFIDSAYELGRKVACKTQGMDLQKRKRRLWAAAGRKGHSPEAIRQVAADLFTNEDL
ncbi:regulatory protein RecX [Bifidobacterium actinocoloniiforme]|uniref:regulatory protein RecX n=1 Tax=Bifidobacterium actinocoloniiforme TaxID=638619 RepID=UPI00068F2AD9|nr:regulatory protein RecX [Bifidobacterium actinocoloniiforme]AKV56087.1 RecX family transcriptional regulator [Bifidobacterium actinocoloniiforme DSM 22766]